MCRLSEDTLSGQASPNPKSKARNPIASGKLGKGGRASNSETFRWNPAGNQSRPAEPGQQPEASLAWWRGDPPCEA